jgi:hypothetical protein
MVPRPMNPTGAVRSDAIQLLLQDVPTDATQ